VNRRVTFRERSARVLARRGGPVGRDPQAVVLETSTAEDEEEGGEGEELTIPDSRIPDSRIPE
jgi:hypothetical protein